MAVRKTQTNQANRAAQEAPKNTVVKIKHKTVTFKHRTIFADKDGYVEVTPDELEQLKKMKLV